jgi:cytochrome c oxidase subunit IV
MDQAARELAAARRRKMSIGTAVFAALIVLDGVEYIVAQVADQTLLWMGMLAIPQAGLIVWFYMHVHQLSGRKDH